MIPPNYKDINIKNVHYTIRYFYAATGLKVLTKLTKLLGEPMTKMMQAGELKKDADPEQQNLKMAKIVSEAVSSLAERIDEDAVVDLVKNLMSCVYLGSRSLDNDWDREFQGKFDVLLQLCIEVVSYNFSDFLSAVSVGKTSQSTLTTTK